MAEAESARKKPSFLAEVLGCRPEDVGPTGHCCPKLSRRSRDPSALAKRNKAKTHLINGNWTYNGRPLPPASYVALPRPLAEFLKHLARFSNEFAHCGSALECLLRIAAVLERISIAARSA